MAKTTPIFETSTDSKTLAAVLAAATVGQIISYDELSKAIGRTVTASKLSTARHIVQREQRIVFGAVAGVGLKRLSDAEIVDLSDSARDHLRRTTRKTAKKLHCVDYDAMPKDKQTKHNTALSMLGVIGELSTEKSTQRLSQLIESTGTSLPTAKAAIAALGSTVK